MHDEVTLTKRRKDRPRIKRERQRDKNESKSGFRDQTRIQDEITAS